MLALLYFLLSVGAGAGVATILPLTLRRLQFLAIAVAIGLPLAAWLSLGLSFVLGYAIGLPLTFIGLFGVAGFAATRQHKPLKLTAEPYSHHGRILAWIMGLSILALLTWITYMSYGRWPDSAGDFISNGNVWADGPLHLSLANQFASNGNHVDLVAPYYNHSPLTYPFIPDFYSGMLHKLGWSWSLAFLIPGLALVASLGVLVFTAGHRLTGSVRAAWIQLLLLVFSGSTAGAFYYGSFVLKGDFASIWNQPLQLGMALEDMVFNFVQAFLMPQRGYMFGMPMMMIAIILGHWLWIQPKFEAKEKRVALLLGGLIGLMPLVHTHSFYVTAGLLGLTGVIAAVRSRHQLIRLAWVIVPAAILAVPQAYWQFSNTYYGGFQKSILGWKMTAYVDNPLENWVIYWIKGGGILFGFMGLGWLALRRYKASGVLWLFYVAGVTIFAAANLYVFQPSVWDNAKFFVYAFWCVGLPLAYVLAAISRRRLGMVAAVAVIWSLTFMGGLTIIHSAAKLNYQIVSATEAVFAKQVRDMVGPEAVIVTADRHNDPVFVLSGRKVMMVYSGWYNLYNVDWTVIWAARDAIVKGGVEADRQICERQLKYVTINETESASGRVNADYFKATYPALVHVGTWWLFDVGGACDRQAAVTASDK